MRATPIHDGYNVDLLQMIPADASRVVEVGCSSGALARAYRARNPDCEYIGIERQEIFATVARPHCARVVVADIENLTNAQVEEFRPTSCWVFGDVLEHLFDPWAVLRRIRISLAPNASVVACIPNAQHWSVQTRLLSGTFKYEEEGLLDFTHIRWFTRQTIGDLFRSSGYEIVEGGGRVFDEPPRDRALAGIRAFAEAIGRDPDVAVENATPYQWLVRAVPALSA
jgi:SAM-dependent methyltransferase